MKALMLLAAFAGQAQPRPCVTDAEAEAVTLVALPEIVRHTGAACATRLPARSLVRQANSPLLSRLDAEADRAWPAARGAIGRVIGPQADGLLGSDLARPLLTSLLAPLIVGRVQPGDCATIERVATLVEPLPPRNAAALVVTTLRHLQARGDRNVASLPLCPVMTR